MMRLSEPPRDASLPVAIVGAACRLPGAPDLAAFARLLAEGRDAVTQVPPDRFCQAQFLHPTPGEPGRAPHFRAGILAGDPLQFDAAGFGISPREAAEMDPQQRLLLQLAREALRDAGWPEARLAGTRTGAWVGASTTDWSDLRRHDPAGGDRHVMTGGALSILANRLSNALDLRGPALVVDTACSSALVALDAACRALASGEAEAALVGGVNLLLSPFPFGGFWRAGMLSLRGRCQAFGAGADGYVRAEGGVVLALKPLAAALAAGDAVRGVILATGVNAAGRTNGLSLPDRAAQARLMAEVLARAGLDADQLAAFEAHGTGTPAGDPIEAAAIAEAVARRRTRPLPIGSAKSNIGHTEAASGLVGVLKSALMLERGRLFPTLHAEVPNPTIPWREHNIALARGGERLRGRAIGVNSFGFGGTNACAVLGAAPPARLGAAPPVRLGAAPPVRLGAAPPARLGAAGVRASPPLLLSARTPAALRALAEGWHDLLRREPPARRLALLRGQARRRDLLPERLALRGDLRAGLERFLAGEDQPGAGTAPAGGAGIAFVFSGNGAQWVGMARAELRLSPAFRRGVAEADVALAPHLGRSPLALLRRGATAAELARTDLAQPLLFAVQWGIVAALAEQGIRPALVLGHSVGEVAAAAVAGLLSLDAAARLIVARSRHQHATRGTGRMAALSLGTAAAAPLLERNGPGLEVAAVNAPAALTIAGPAEAIERLGDEAAASQIACLALDLDYAFHAAAMDPVRLPLLRELRRLRGRVPRLPMISSVTGEPLGAADMGAEYWWRNLRAPVRFDLAVRGAALHRPALFLEIGPHPVLQGYLRANLREAGLAAGILATLRRDEALAADPFPALADRATALGADPRGAACFAGPALWRGLPEPPPEGDALPFHHSAEAARLVDARHDHPLLGFRKAMLTGDTPEEWTRTLDALEEPWLADHRLFGEAVLPATAMLEMALAAGFLRHPAAPAMEAGEMVLLRPLPLEPARQLRARLDAEGRFTLESRRRLAEGEGWVLHAQARVVPMPALPPAPGLPIEDGEPVAPEAALAAAAALGLDYGPAFRAVCALEVDRAARRVRARLDRPETAPPDAGFHLHPSRADGALQALLGLLGAEARPGDGFVPARFGRVTLRRQAPAPVSAEAELVALGERSAEARLVLRDGLGAAVAVIEGAALARFRRPAEEVGAPQSFHTEWVPAPPPPGWPEPPSLAVAALDLARLAAPAPLALAEAGLLAEAALAAAAGEALAAAAPSCHPSLRAALEPFGELPPAAALWAQAWEEAPALAADLAHIAALGEALPEALAGRAAAPLPRPHGAAEHLLAARLAEAAAALAVTWPAERPLRVLALGAAALAPALRQALAGRVESRAEVWTEVWAPAGEAAPPLEAELVVCLGLTPGCAPGAAFAEGLRRAVAPGGALLLAEPAPGLLWEAHAALAADQPRPAPLEAWHEALAAAGWEGVRGVAVPAAPWAASLLLANAPMGGRLLPAAPARRFALYAAAAVEPFAQLLAETLAGSGAQVVVLRLSAEPAPRALRGATVVGLPAGPADLPALGRLAAAAEGAAVRFALCGHADGVGGGVLGEAAMAFGRVLANEMPALRPLRFALAPDLAPEMAARLLAAALLAHEEGEPEQRLAPGGRLVPRAMPGLPAPPRAPGPLRLAVTRPGQLASLRWEAAPAFLGAGPGDVPGLVPVPGDVPGPGPGPGEVLVRVAAAGLNFRDVMWAQGLLPEEALRPGFCGPGLGMEFAGTVEAVGAGVAFAPGERVFGVAPRALATRALTRAEAVATLPPALSFEEGATLPVAFLTALHALEECARLAAGERVLIHGGAGAVGLAALQVALAAGARVAATAGSPERRALLRRAGAELVCDSRDLRFEGEIRAAWGGVDVALNSLAGEAMERTLALMAPFGRFLELGKRDYAENRRVALRPLRRNVAYFAVDVDELARARPARAAALMADLAARLADGRLRPLPYQVHDGKEVEEAFRALQAGGHIGKRVVRPPAEQPGAARAALPEGPVVVAGGAAGFGLEAACWLAARGVRRIAVLSRRPVGQDARARLAALGAEVRGFALDAADGEAVGEALAQLRAEWGPIHGVVHAAAIYEDATAGRLDEAAAAAVWRAKVGVAEALECATADDPLSLFLLFSSAAVAIGSPGQSAYVAANAGLEAIARRRVAAGLPALAVQWGPVADAGLLARAPADAASLERRIGAEALPAQALLDALPALLACGAPVAGVGRIGWAGARAALPLLAEPAFAALAGGGSAGEGEDDLRRRLRAAAPEEALGLLREAVANEVARILRLPAGAVPPDAPLSRLGLDSLGGLELRTGLERRLALPLPLSADNDGVTVEALSRRLHEGLRAPEAAE